MRYSPYAEECDAVETMANAELLDYFISRTVESEEVWGLGDETGWIMRERGSQTILPVWPYRKYALDCAADEWKTQAPNAVSLEHFVYRVLHLLIDQDVQVEVMPRQQAAGCLIGPQRLREMFEGVIDAGEYTLDG
jgi:hypothetical protein